MYWAGNLISTQKDGSGYIYKRNRYYDPSSGRFTQVDPIGLAGGLNAYGFAGGDPVNFSDPFGLTCLLEGNCDQSDHAGDLRTVPGVVVFAGVTGTAAGVGAGVTGAEGIAWNPKRHTLGTYVRTGVSFSHQLVGGLELGLSGSEAVFHGTSAGGCVSAGSPVSGGGCGSANNDGGAGSVNVQAGLSPPVSAGGEITNTKTTPHAAQRIYQAVSDWAQKHHLSIPDI